MARTVPSSLAVLEPSCACDKLAAVVVVVAAAAVVVVAGVGVGVGVVLVVVVVVVASTSFSCETRGASRGLAMAWPLPRAQSLAQKSIPARSGQKPGTVPRCISHLVI